MILFVSAVLVFMLVLLFAYLWFTRGGDLGGTNWRLVAYGPENEPILPVNDSTITLEFTSSTELSGSAGCNSYFGVYESGKDSFATESVGMTEMYCMDEALMNQESAYFRALTSARKYELSADRLKLFYNGSALVFEPAP